jgi:cytochrome c-type biogenesis protein
LYPPGEHIVLEKAEEENGLIGYALLKLYSHTNKAIYLGTGLKTIGSGLSQAGGLDRGYYFAKAAQLILEKSLLSDFAKVQEHFQSVELERQKDFWLDDIAVAPVERKFHVSDEGADTLGGPLGILLLIALFAGLLSFLSPCTLPILPAFVTYSFRSSRKNIARMTVSFFLGLSLLFVVLGMSATALGGFLQNNLTSFSQIAGVILILFGVFMLSGKGFSGFSVQKRKPGTYLESFLFGAALGLSWTPCVGPILVAILVVASTSSSAFTGGLLLFMYAVGLALPLVLISLYVKKIDYHSQLWRILKGKEVSIFGWKIHTNSLIPGLLFILLGYLMFSGTLYTFNQYIVSSSLQKWMFGLEEKLLSWVR